MGRRPTYKVKDFEDKIAGSGGIIDTIAKRVGCNWITAKIHIDKSPVLTALLNEELERRSDLAESLIINNMVIASKLQKNGQIVDTGDAKWYLSRKAKDRGYVERQEIKQLNIDVDSLSDEQLERIANGEDIYSVATSGKG